MLIQTKIPYSLIVQNYIEDNVKPKYIPHNSYTKSLFISDKTFSSSQNSKLFNIISYVSYEAVDDWLIDSHFMGTKYIAAKKIKTYI